LLLTHACEGQVDVLVGTSAQDNELLPEAGGRGLHDGCIWLRVRVVGVHEKGDYGGCGYEFAQ
jgi:hypothetical protein